MLELVVYLPRPFEEMPFSQKKHLTLLLALRLTPTLDPPWSSPQSSVCSGVMAVCNSSYAFCISLISLQLGFSSTPSPLGQGVLLERLKHNRL